MKHIFSRGEGRLQVNLEAMAAGQDWLIRIYNQNAHVGAVAVGEYDIKTDRTSVSVITRIGHKDDVIAQKAAYLISKSLHRTSCVVVGIHLDNVIQSEISELKENALDAVEDFLQELKS